MDFQQGRYVLSLYTLIKNPNKPTTFAVSMEYTGFEPVASTMRMWRAPNCANTPLKIISRKNRISSMYLDEKNQSKEILF